MNLKKIINNYFTDIMENEMERDMKKTTDIVINVWGDVLRYSSNTVKFIPASVYEAELSWLCVKSLLRDLKKYEPKKIINYESNKTTN